MEQNFASPRKTFLQKPGGKVRYNNNNNKKNNFGLRKSESYPVIALFHCPSTHNKIAVLVLFSCITPRNSALKEILRAICKKREKERENKS